jgi:hypothetical protein
MDFDYTIKHPANIICVGMTQSGKSSLVAQIIKRNEEIIFPKIERIIYCYVEYQPKLFGEIGEAVGDMIEFVKGLEVDVPEGNTTPTLVILDDLMEQAASEKQVTELFTKVG